MSVNIWPRRSIKLAGKRRDVTMAHPFLNSEQTEEIKKVLQTFGCVLDGVATICRGVRQLALVYLGTDGISGGSLLLCVTNESNRVDGSLLKLVILPYDEIGSCTDVSESFLPSQAAELLDNIRAALCEQLGAAVADG